MADNPFVVRGEDLPLGSIVQLDAGIFTKTGDPHPGYGWVGERGEATGDRTVSAGLAYYGARVLRLGWGRPDRGSVPVLVPAQHPGGLA